MRTRHRLSARLLGFLLTAVALSAQISTHRVPDATNVDSSNGGMHKDDDSSPEPNQRVHGEITFAEGQGPIQLVEVNAVCPAFTRLMAIPNAKGRFSFSFDPDRLTDRELANRCTLQPLVDGYRSEPIRLDDLNTRSGRNLGKIALTLISPDRRAVSGSTDGQTDSDARRVFSKVADKASKQDWTGAAELLRERIAKHQTDSHAWLNLGILEQIQGDDAKAEKYYLEAAKDAPQFAVPLLHAASLELTKKEYDASRLHSQAAIDLNPKAFPRAYSLNSSANLAIRHDKAAEKNARAGLELDTAHQYPELEFVLGSVLYGRHELKGATEHLRRYIQLLPNGVNAGTAANQLSRIHQEANALIGLTGAAAEASTGPRSLLLSSGTAAGLLSVQKTNNALLAGAETYTCLASVLSPSGSIRTGAADIRRSDIAVSDGKEIYGAVDGKQFSKKLNELTGDHFSTTGLFSSIARVVLAAKKVAVSPAGEVNLAGETELRFNFHSLPGSADWAITNNQQSATAGEEGWFLIDKGTLELRTVFVRAINIPDTLRLLYLDALISYQSETLAGRRALLPNKARVEVGELDGVKRVNLISFDHCQAFTAESTVLFAEPTTHVQVTHTATQSVLPDELDIVVTPLTSLSLATLGQHDVIAAQVTQSVRKGGRELIASGAPIEGHAWAIRGQETMVIQFDRVLTKDGWRPFYARLLSLEPTNKMTIETGPYVSSSMLPEDADSFNLDVPGVATIRLNSQASALTPGIRMVWKTEPLLNRRSEGRLPQMSTSGDLK